MSLVACRLAPGHSFDSSWVCANRESLEFVGGLVNELTDGVRHSLYSLDEW